MPSVSTICVKSIYRPALSWKACFLHNKVQTTFLFCLPTAPFLNLSPFIFFHIWAVNSTVPSFVLWNWLEYLRAKLKQTVILQSEISQSGLGAAVGNQDVSQPHAQHITQSMHLCTWCPWAKRTKLWTQKTKPWTQKTHSEELTLLATQTNPLSFETTWWMKLIWQILYAYITGIYF